MPNSILGMTILKDDSVDLLYNISDLPLYIKKEELANFPKKRTAPHWNAGLETIYIESGSMNITVNGKTIQLNENDVCVINAGCVHFFESIADKNCIYYCGIADESLYSTADGIKTRYLQPIFHSYHPNIDIVRSTSRYSAQIRNVIRRINLIITEKPTAYDLLATALFHEYIAILYTAMKDSFFVQDNPSNEKDEAIRKMIAYIHKNYSEPIRIEDLCEVGLIPRNRVFRLFKKYTDDSPAAFLLKVRLYKARAALITENTSISEIAESCGFTHQSHFTNHFTKYFGMTPLQFRKQHHQTTR